VGSYRYVVVDVFTNPPLQGNQLAVFTDARELPEELLQPLAREMNFSETVTKVRVGVTEGVGRREG
jgi:trans-2,3-dihydro-3-hydroxyanthranilate isomerase